MIFDSVDGLEIGEEWEIGYRMPELIVTVDNAGDTVCGVTIRFAAAGDVDTPKLLNVVTGEYVQLNLAMVRGDVAEVTTKYGNKRATLYSGGEESNIFRLVDSGSSFLQLDVGEEMFKVEALSGIDDLDVTIKYNNQYLGV